MNILNILFFNLFIFASPSVVIVRKEINEPLHYKKHLYREGVGAKYVALPFRGEFMPLDLNESFVFFKKAKWISGSNYLDYSGGNEQIILEDAYVENIWKSATIHLVASVQYTVGTPTSIVDFGCVRQEFIGNFSTHMYNRIGIGKYHIRLIARGINPWKSLPSYGDGYQTPRQWSIFIVRENAKSNRTRTQPERANRVREFGGSLASLPGER